MNNDRLHPALIGVFCIACVSCASDPSAADVPSHKPAVALIELFKLTPGESRSDGFVGPIARQFGDGRLLIADEGRSTLHIFSQDGQFERSLAIGGQGPGEVEPPFHVALRQDTVVMISLAMGARQISWLRLSADERGVLSPPRTQPDVANTPAFTVLDRFSTGEWLVRKGSQFQAMQEVPEPGALRADSVTLGVLQHTEALTDTSFAWLPKLEQATMLWFAWPNGPMRSAMTPHPQRPGVLYAVSEDALWTLDAVTGEGKRWVNGVPRLRFVVETEPEVFADSDLRPLRERALADAVTALDSSRALAIYDPGTAPKAAPRASRLVPAHDGTVWMEVFRLDSTSARKYLALDASGAVRGVFSTPPSVRLQYVGPTLVLGVRTDDNDLADVRAFANPFVR